MYTMYKAIQIALDKIYYMTDDGRLIGPKGQVKITLYGKQKYPTFSVSGVPGPKNKNGVFAVPVHKFAACFFFGIEKVMEANCVRHLDGNVLNLAKTNLSLGTHSENNLDKNLEIRSAAAAKARAAQGSRPLNAKFSDEQIVFIKTSTLSGVSLAKMFDVTPAAISNIRKGKNYADITA